MLTIMAVGLCFLAGIGILVCIVRNLIVTKHREKENEQALAAVAPELGLSLVAGTGVIKLAASGFTSTLFTGGLNPRTDHALETRIGGRQVVIFNYIYEERSDDGVNTYKQTVAAFASQNPIPHFVLQKKNLLSKMKFHKIHLVNNPDFENRFVLTGPDSGAVQKLFGPDLAGFLLTTNLEQKYTLEGSGPWVVLWQKGTMRATGLRALLDETAQIADGFFQNCGAIETVKAG